MSSAPAPRRLLVALSGGVDSAVAATLMADQGHELVGVFMRNGVSGQGASRSCCSVSDARDARAVAAHLAIPFYVQDLARPFAELIDAFARDYAAGLTPNPCVVCNDRLKFGELWELAADLSCDGVVTGHYARLRDGRLSRAVDRAKDQSYLLHGLTAEQRAMARFPLGDLPKARVRELAAERGLPVAAKPDSADICFVPGGDYRAVVRERLGDLGPAGEVVDEQGRVLARHEGVGAFTVGQRRGLGVALGRPAFVTAIDPARGRVTVGDRDGLERPACRIEGLRWHERPEQGARLLVQLRHHHQPEPVVLRHEGEDGARLEFERPSRAVSPGQYAVLYREDLVLGGGRLAREPAPLEAGP